MKQTLISRRTVLAGTAAAGATGLLGFPAFAAEVDWKKFAGTKLEVILAKGPRGDNLQKYAKEFTELTRYPGRVPSRFRSSSSARRS